jgi:hypothetical protein
VFVLMVLVVHMLMFVLDCFMRMFVRVLLGNMQPNANYHQGPGNREHDRNWFIEYGDG